MDNDYNLKLLAYFYLIVAPGRENQHNNRDDAQEQHHRPLMNWIGWRLIAFGNRLIDNPHDAVQYRVAHAK